MVREIDGFEGSCGGDGGRGGGDALDVEGGGQIGFEGSGEGIAVARVGGGAIADEGESARGVEEGGDVEMDEDSGVFVEVEVGAEGDGSAVRVAGEVPREALRIGGGGGGAEVAFEGHEDVVLLPAPVEPVEVRVERVGGGEAGGIGGVGGGVRADVEAESAVAGRGDGVEG